MATSGRRKDWSGIVTVSHANLMSHLTGVGQGGAGGARAPPLSKVGGTRMFVPPHFLT